ncbi:MAG: PepSY domain-containing protein [Burkholderiales bacterium]|nr:PepSY domain-containing protein [Burkholderiales bacterium]
MPALEPSAIIDVMGAWASGRRGPVLIVAVVAAASMPCHGQPGGFLDYVRAGPSRESRLLAERRVSLDQAVVIAQKHTGGRVLDARPQGEGYRVKVLTRGGEVVVVYVDAKTGDVH